MRVDGTDLAITTGHALLAARRALTSLIEVRFMRIGAGVERWCFSSVYNPGHKLAKADIKVPTPCGRISPFAHLEPTETVAQAPRFARHLIDIRRHALVLTARKTHLYSWYIRHIEVSCTAPRPPGVKIRHAENHAKRAIPSSLSGTGERTSGAAKMRNPDPWQPPERTPEPPPASRRAALIGLAMILILMLAGLFLTHTLGGMARLQDCALSGRPNCSTNL